MGGMFNADTQQTVTQYFFTVPADDLDVALRIELIRMRGVLNEERLWQEERGAIEQEVAQDLSSPEYIFYTKLLAALFQGTPYAYTPLGTVGVVRQDDRSHAPEVPRDLVCPEQCHPGDRGRRAARRRQWTVSRSCSARSRRRRPRSNPRSAWSR